MIGHTSSLGMSLLGTQNILFIVLSIFDLHFLSLHVLLFIPIIFVFSFSSFFFFFLSSYSPILTVNVYPFTFHPRPAARPVLMCKEEVTGSIFTAEPLPCAPPVWPMQNPSHCAHFSPVRQQTHSFQPDPPSPSPLLFLFQIALVCKQLVCR